MHNEVKLSSARGHNLDKKMTNEVISLNRRTDGQDGDRPLRTQKCFFYKNVMGSNETDNTDNLGKIQENIKEAAKSFSHKKIREAKRSKENSGGSQATRKSSGCKPGEPGRSMLRNAVCVDWQNDTEKKSSVGVTCQRQLHGGQRRLGKRVPETLL